MADPENPTIEPKIKWIDWSATEITQLQMKGRWVVGCWSVGWSSLINIYTCLTLVSYSLRYVRNVAKKSIWERVVSPRQKFKPSKRKGNGEGCPPPQSSSRAGRHRKLPQQGSHVLKESICCQEMCYFNVVQKRTCHLFKMRERSVQVPSSSRQRGRGMGMGVRLPSWLGGLGSIANSPSGSHVLKESICCLEMCYLSDAQVLCIVNRRHITDT